MDRQKDLLSRVLLPSKKKALFYGLSIFGRFLFIVLQEKVD